MSQTIEGASFPETWDTCWPPVLSTVEAPTVMTITLSFVVFSSLGNCLTLSDEIGGPVVTPHGLGVSSRQRQVTTLHERALSRKRGQTLSNLWRLGSKHPRLLKPRAWRLIHPTPLSPSRQDSLSAKCRSLARDYGWRCDPMDSSFVWSLLAPLMYSICV